MAYARDAGLDNNWDPMATSYNDSNINSYEHGPGVNLTPYARPPPNSECKLYVNQIPLELTENGIRQIFNRYGMTTGVFFLPGNSWAFVTYSNYREAQEAILDLNEKPPLNLTVTFAKQNTSRPNRNQQPLHGMPNIEPAAVARPSPTLLENQRREYVSPEQRPMHIRPMVQNLGRGTELAALTRRASGVPIGNQYHETDDLLYPAIRDPNYYNPYEDGEPFPETNNMWARDRLQVSNDGTRFVTMGRGYTWYKLPNQHPRVAQQIRAVYEKREAGLYEYGENKLAQQIGKCQNCAQSAAMRCQRCREFYCSRACQETDWPRHKIECQAMPALEGGADSGSLSMSSGEDTPQQVPKKRSIGRLRRPLTTPAPLKASHSTSLPVTSTSPTPEMPGPILACIPREREKENEPNLSQDNNFKRNHSGNPKEDFNQNKTPHTGCWNPMKNDGDNETPRVRDAQARGPNVNQRFNASNGLPNQDDNAAQKDPQGSSDNKYQRGQNAGTEKQQPGGGQTNRNFYNRDKSSQQKNYQQINEKVKELKINDKETPKPAIKPPLTVPDFTFHKASDMPEEIPRVKSPTKVTFQEPEIEAVAGPSGVKIPPKEVGNEAVKKAPVQVAPKTLPPAAKKDMKNVIELLDVNEEGCFEAHVLLGGNKAAVTVCVLKFQDEYSKISSELTPECEKTPQPAQFSPKIGDFVAGKRLDDWIRGTVTALGPPVRLAAVDEGRVEEVTNLKPVPQGFSDLPTLGAICELTEGDFKLEAMAQYTFLVVNKKPDAVNDGVEIVLFSADEKEGKGVLKPWTPAPEQRGIPYATLTSGTEVCVASFRSHAAIFVRSLGVKDMENFNRITQEVALWSTKADKLKENPVLGEIIIAKYIEDGNFYRAIVRKIEDKKITVSYIDFGNVEVTTLDNLRVISQKLKEYPSCAARALLKDVSRDVPMNKEVSDYLGMLAGTEKPLMCTFQGSPATDGVILKAADGSFVNQKINELLTPSWKKEEDKTSVFMIGDLDVAELGNVGQTTNVLALFSYGALMHAMAPQDVELVQHVTAVMPAQMKEYCEQLKSNYIPRQNELCLAPYQGSWYRAVCLEPNTTNKTATVNFIDFGNIEEIPHTDLRLMNKDFLSTNTLASVCTVVGLGPVGEDGELPPAIGARVTELIPINSPTLVKIIECTKPGEYVVELPEVKEILVKEGLLKV